MLAAESRRRGDGACPAEKVIGFEREVEGSVGTNGAGVILELSRWDYKLQAVASLFLH